MKHFIFGGMIAFAMVLLAGCTSDRELLISEILQLKKDQRVFLAHNLWSNKNDVISSMNYQTGSIIPFGSEVKDIKLDDDNDAIEFTTAHDGLRYKLQFEGSLHMVTLERYVKHLFTTDSLFAQREFLLKDYVAITKKSREKADAEFDKLFWDARKGVVKRGMTRRMVIAAFGFPSAHRTPNLKENSTWIYWTEPVKTFRVIFKKDLVIDVVHI